jgi:predicted membrane chloride channel (bestrophin family)
MSISNFNICDLFIAINQKLDLNVYMTNPKSNNQQWFTRAFNLEHYVIPKTKFRLGVVNCVSVVVTIAFYSRLYIALPLMGSIVPNIILGNWLIRKEDCFLNCKYFSKCKTYIHL